MQSILVFLLTFAFSACALTKSGTSPSAKGPQKTPETVNTNPGNPDNPGTPNNTQYPSGNTQTYYNDASIHPKLLFHGGGGFSFQGLIDMTPAAATLVNLGVPTEHIYLINYPHTKNIQDIKIAVEPQLRSIFSRYPPATQFDSIGHSLGLLASFISISELGYLPKMRSIIGVTGPLMRQDEGALPAGCTQGNPNDLCGDIFDLVVGATDSPYILGLLNTHATEMQRINKCSIWTSQDGVLSPPNAGVFPGGKSVEMPITWCSAQSFFSKINPCHLQAKAAMPVFVAMRDVCFDGSFR